LQEEERLQNFFEQLFPGKVETAVIGSSLSLSLSLSVCVFVV
jgi:hypothetical protein